MAGALPFVFVAFRTSPVDKAIGDLSYPLYICHVLVISVVTRLASPQAVWLMAASALAVSIALLLAIERPLDAWRQRRIARQARPLGDPVLQAGDRY